MIVLKTLEQIDKIRKACKLVAIGLSEMEQMVQPGLSTNVLDSWAEDFCYKNNALPGFKGYKGYQHTLCTSINSEVVHGLPRKEPLKEGDILSIDFGVLLDGYYGDSSITVPVGEVSDEAKHLIKTGQECLYKGIKQAYKGNRLNQISYAVQSHAERNRYSVIRRYVGHGIGANLHEEPSIYNHTTKPNEGIILQAGMVVAIEPMVLQYTHHVIDGAGWTVKTKDGGLAVHWEHTIVILEEETEILTLREGERPI